MSSVPRWSLATAETETASIDLRHNAGAAVNRPVVVLDVAPDDDPARWATVERALRPLAVVAVSGTPGVGDVAGDVDALTAAVLEHPHAATVAAQVLRGVDDDASTAFERESLAYATLQAGPEHAAWLAGQGRRVRNDDESRVRVDDGDPITVTLTRGRLHNLIDRRARDEIVDAFDLTRAMDADREIVWRGEGPSFCAGGDPAEFGSVADPTTAHLIRSAAGPASAILAVAHRLTVEVHGACVGAGVELAALAGRVHAAPDARFRLPELSMGLIPGVGGTWSISRRIGRARTLEWLLLDLELDANTGLDWGLIDRIDPPE